MSKRHPENLTNDPEVLALNAREAVKPPSMANAVLRYCKTCKQMKPKAGSHADAPKFECPACLGEEEE